MMLTIARASEIRAAYEAGESAADVARRIGGMPVR